MIQCFKNQGTEDLFNGLDTKASRKVCPEQQAWPACRRKLELLDAARDLRDLKSPGSSLERLDKTKGKGIWGFRVNNRYRVCFRWEEGNAYDVEVTDYH